jgi:hypothetical protein
MVALRDDLIAALCPKPCRAAAITMSQRRLMPDGSVEVSGDLPPPLCAGCPERGDPKAPIRHIEVRYGFEPGADIGEVADTDESAIEGAGIAIIRVLYDAPRSAHPGR